MLPQETMNGLRSLCWHQKTGAAKNIYPDLKRLPSTDTGYREHVKRVVYQLRGWQIEQVGLCQVSKSSCNG